MEENNEHRKYYLIMVFMYFTLPIFFMFLDETMKQSISFGYISALNPIVIFAASLIYAVRHGFVWKYSITAGLAFLPAIFIYFDFRNILYYVFAITYAIMSFAGIAAGMFIKRFI